MNQGDQPLTGEPGQTKELPETAGPSLALVVLVGVACFALLVIVLGSVVHVGDPMAYVAALAIATFAGGRAGGIRGLGYWLLATILIGLASFFLGYLFLWILFSQMTGP